MTGASIRIAIVDDHPTLLMGLAAVLAADPIYRVIGTGTTADEAVDLATAHSPDVLLLDLSMPGDAFGAIRQIVEASPDAKVVVFTAYDEIGLVARAMDAGARGFVLKGRPIEDLHGAIVAAFEGRIYLSPDIAAKLDAVPASGSTKLSPREEQLVACLLEAKSNKEIERQLGLTEKTVKHYMTNLMNKLNVRSRLEVVIAARSLRTGPAHQQLRPELTREPG
ncbi:MAG: response regulator transcription factor [Devosia sp.]